MLRRTLSGIWVIVIVFFISFGAKAEELSVRNPLEWLDTEEVYLLGRHNPGNLLERLNQFEEVMVGRVREGSLVQRLNYLNTLLFVNQPYDICATYKIQALEWVIFRQVYPEPLYIRIEKLEKVLFGKPSSGPMAIRLEKMVSQVFPEGTVKGHWVSVPEGILVKIKLLDEVSSAKSSAGDEFRYQVIETVASNNMVIIPKGTVGYGMVSRITRPGNLGIDARLMLDFREIRALDSTMVALQYSAANTPDINRPRQLAVGASAAGMLILGPEGILFGMAVRGQEKTISVDAEFFVQVKKPVRIYTLQI
jgi:hypothetical protein